MRKVLKIPIDNASTMLLRAGAGLTLITESLGLGVLFYLGTFTRFIADDYCEMVNLRKDSLLRVVFQHYMNGNIRASNRFSHLLLVSWSEQLGPYSVQILPTLMICLWLAGLTWTIYGFRKLAKIQLPAGVDFFLALMIVFFSAIQAPNQFQTFFWRSSVTTHFAPLVLMFILSGFMLWQIRLAQGRLPAFWVAPLVFLGSFIIGSVSEPPAALMLVVAGGLMVLVWRSHLAEKKAALILLVSCLTGVFLALCVMFLAPGNQMHGKTTFLILPITAAESLEFAFEFIWDTILTLPVPTLVSFLLPCLFFIGLSLNEHWSLASNQQRYMVPKILLSLLVAYLLIVVTFSPSAYGQAYPVERARFIGRFLMTAGMIFAGVLLGVWVAQLRQVLTYRHVVFPVVGILVVMAGLYPLRSTSYLWDQIDSYRAWASAWDQREAEIISRIASGEKDLVVAWLENRYRVKEIDGNPRHWVNRCISSYYGMNSIYSFPMDQ